MNTKKLTDIALRAARPTVKPVKAGADKRGWRPGAKKRRTLKDTPGASGGRGGF